MRGLSVEDLVNIRDAKTSYTNVENDIPQILEVVEVKKHILMLFPYVFSLDQGLRLEAAIEMMRTGLNDDFGNLFLYREKVSPGFDTYLTTVFSDLFLIFKIIDGSFSLIESVSIENTPTYKRLFGLGDIWG